MSVTEQVSTLRSERERQGMSLRELAYFAGGVSYAAIQQAELGRLNLSPAIKTRLAHALRVRVDVLWGPQEDDARPAGEPGAVTTHRADLGGGDDFDQS